MSDSDPPSRSRVPSDDPGARSTRSRPDADSKVREPITFQVRAIAFLGEQDGPPERDLKQALSVIFSGEPSVSRAFLAKVTHDFAIPGVALCVCLRDSGAQSSRALPSHLTREIARAFAEIFASVEHLDVVVLSSAEEHEASRVCRPFYEVRPSLMKTVFQASRWTSGNRLFPVRIEIKDEAVVRRKRSWLSTSEESIHLSRVASVRIEARICFADVRIESSGGGDDLVSHGHWKGDAFRLRDLIQEWQTRNLPRASTPNE